MNDPIPEALSNAVNALVDNRETWARAALDAIKPDPITRTPRRSVKPAVLIGVYRRVHSHADTAGGRRYFFQ